MIESMRLVLITLVLGCGSKDDYPAVPQPLEWHQIPRAPLEGKLEGTGYRIELPRGAGSQPISDNEVELTSSGLKVAVRLEPDFSGLEDPIERTGIAFSTKEIYGDGWAISYEAGRAVFSHRYIDDSVLTCSAVSSDATEHTQILLRICKSLIATTAIANPPRYLDGMSPSQVRAGMCGIAVDHVALLDLPKKKSKRKPTPEEVKLAEQRAAAKRAQHESCVRERWQPKSIQCLIGATRLDETAKCGVKL